MRSSASTTNHTSYQAGGRVTASEQVTEGRTCQLQYGYNAAGMLTSIRYPSGRTVTTGYVAPGWITAIAAGTKDGESAKTYATVAEATYAAHGEPEHVQLANGIWDNRVYNGWLQPSYIAAGSTGIGAATDWDVLKLSYDYGTTNNNGNVLGQTINAAGTSFTQSYTYADGVNRLTSVSEGSGWSRTFGYDQYGNQWVSGYSRIWT